MEIEFHQPLIFGQRSKDLLDYFFSLEEMLGVLLDNSGVCIVYQSLLVP